VIRGFIHQKVCVPKKRVAHRKIRQNNSDFLLVTRSASNVHTQAYSWHIESLRPPSGTSTLSWRIKQQRLTAKDGNGYRWGSVSWQTVKILTGERNKYQNVKWFAPVVVDPITLIAESVYYTFLFKPLL